MRTLFAWVLILLVSACSDRTERPASSGALATIPAGPDPIVLRVSRSGGLVTAARYPNLDSTVWRSSYRVPALAQVLGHHADDGYLAAVDTAGRPVRLDLRLGAVAVPGSAGGAQHASADGAVLYALNVEGDVARYTPVGDRWTITPGTAPAAIVPLADGSVVLVSREAGALQLRRLRPPDTAVVDSLRLDVEAADGTVRGVTVGDRIFLSAGAHMLSLRTRDFVADLDVNTGADIRHFVTSPSGDRVFALSDNASEVTVIDRFEGDVDTRIELPGAGQALRMDPLGRALLVQAPGDSAWVIDIGTSTLTGSVRTAWRSDLPLVLPDGALALVHGDSVALASSIDLGVIRSIPDGAKDFWYTMRWNGFRPRAEGLDEPVRFRASSGGGASRSAAGTVDDSLAALASSAGEVGDSAEPAPDSSGAPSRGDTRELFTVQLAAVLSEELAREAAAGISVDGRTPRISSSVRDGRTLYRVVLGPYPTREAAERAGKATGRTYWVFEGAP
jgi:cell division septation protein DedD